MSSEEYPRRIYPLKDLPPEVKAVTFAKTSRSPDSFKNIAKELNETKSGRFHEKWVLGYGHASVAEHAVLSLAMENVSILATKVIEDNRLASYTEQSTRYQYYDKNRYYLPENLPAGLKKKFKDTAQTLMSNYSRLKKPIRKFMKKKFEPREDESERAYKTRIKASTCDVVRYLLPTATLTNLGWTVNARCLEHGISKFLSHPLGELNQIGEELKEAALEITPVLLKYAEENDYLKTTREEFEEHFSRQSPEVQNNSKEPVSLVEYDKDGQERVLASLFYKYGDYPTYTESKRAVEKTGKEQKKKMFSKAMKSRGKHDQPLRVLEHTSYTFDILMDYGAFRDLQRHRLCTQTNKLLNTKYGYDIPEEIKEAGLLERYEKCMSRAEKTYREISSEYPYQAQYILPLAYRKRTLFTMNLRELFHIVELRTRENGHRSYRKIAHRMAEEVKSVHPLIGSFLRDHFIKD